MSAPFNGDPLHHRLDGHILRDLRAERDDLYQMVGSSFPLPHTAPNVISFEKREKALAAQRCQKRIWSKLDPVTPTIAREFEQLTKLLEEIVTDGEWIEVEDAKNDRLVEPKEIVVAGIRYALTAHQLMAKSRRSRVGGGIHDLRLYLCGACDLVIWPYARKYCNDACRSEYWSRLGVKA